MRKTLKNVRSILKNIIFRYMSFCMPPHIYFPLLHQHILHHAQTHTSENHTHHACTHLFVIDVSKISLHLSLHLFGLPGSCEVGMFFSLRASSTRVSVLSSLSMILRAVTTFLGSLATRLGVWCMIIHSC